MKRLKGMVLNFFLVLISVSNLFAQGIIKDDFKVNDDTLKVDQGAPDLDVDHLGNLVIVWQDPRKNAADIFAQRLDPSGEIMGTNFLVNNQLTGDQRFPSVACGPLSNLVVVWQDTREGNRDIFAQQISSSGDTLGSNFKVNDDPGTKPQIEPGVDFSTKVVVVWEDERYDSGDIFGQILDAHCQIEDTNFKINDDHNGSIQQRPDVASDAIGRFVVVWQDKREGNYDIYAQRFDSSGNFVGNNFKVNDDIGTSLQNFPKISSDSLGNFVVVWQDKRNGDEDIYAQAYDWTGEKKADNFRVNDDQGDAYQGHPDITMDKNGKFVVAWIDKRNEDKDLYAQRYNFNFEPVGKNFRVNSDTGSAEQSESAVGTDGNRIYFTWTDNRNGNLDIFAKVIEWNLTGVREVRGDGKLESLALLQNYPNPFNPYTTICFAVHRERNTVNSPIPATLKIYNIKGQVVRRLVDQDLKPGVYVVIWDGKDNRGHEVATGIYFYQLKIRDYTESKKMLLLK